MRRYAVLLITGFSLFLFTFFVIAGRNSQSQVPALPPVPVPLVPSIVEDIRNTKHNLSSIPPAGIVRNIYTEQTTEICVFCHTPHGASSEAASTLRAPIWNRNLSSARYILYDQVWSTSFEAYEVNPSKPNAPTGYSRLCLSCHDGTIALGSVINLPGSGTSLAPLNMVYPTGQTPAGGAGTMPTGSGVTTEDTRVIGTNLQNDHPISFIFDSALAGRDEELVDPGPALVPPAKVSDPTPISPLRRYSGADLGRFDSVQCTSCHNPHAATYPKFMRASFFNNDPADTNYPSASKILCLYCHDKPGWQGSAHDLDIFIPPPTPSSSNPYDYDGTHTVGQYACRACHDPHTVQGAKRILREGVDFSNNFAIENTCYLCHKPASELGNPQNPPPDIRSEFYKDSNLGMGGTGSAMNVTMAQGHEPVFVSRPQEGVELKSSNPPPFNEYSPGTTIPDTTHIECVDCHNPHQVTKTNRLKGMKGIDINGNVTGAKMPGNSREPYVYEVCLRCHGNSYINLFMGDTFPENQVTASIRDFNPSTGQYVFRQVTYSPRSDPRAGTPVNGANLSMKGYSNKRKEFDPNTMDTAADHSMQLSNPAFHPVAAPGRNGTIAICNQLAVAFNLKSSQTNPGGTTGNCDSDASGTLRNITIQCTDCHNNNAFENVIKGPITGLPNGTSYRRITDFSSAPNPLYNSLMQGYSDNPATPQGPHGSQYIRILRARYNTDILNPGRCYNLGNPAGCSQGDGISSSHWDNFNLCFQCHDRRSFDPNVGNNIDTAGEEKWTNFVGRETITPGLGNWNGNLHKYHLKYTGAYCQECHYNVHSNVEAQNTIYGTIVDGTLPADSEDGIADGVRDTHLINFGPTVFGKDFPKPKWFKDTDGAIHCNLSCHNVDMRSCVYRAPVGVFQCSSGNCQF